MAEAPKAATNGFFASLGAGMSRGQYLQALAKCEGKGPLTPDRVARLKDAINRAFDKKDSGTMEKSNFNVQIQHEISLLNGFDAPSDENVSKLHRRFDSMLDKALGGAAPDPASLPEALSKVQKEMVDPKLLSKFSIKCASCSTDNLTKRLDGAGWKGLLRCEACPKESAAYYCSPDCQKADWAKHKVTCVGMRKCQGPECTKFDHEVRKVNKKGLQLCSQCKASIYCSRECQVAHWKAGHKEACQPRG